MSIFDRTIDEISEYKPLPTGKYLVTPTKYSEGESSQKKTPFIKVEFRILQALDNQDVEGIDFKKVKLSRDFYITDGAQKILNDTLAKGLGVDEVKGLSLGEAMEKFVGTHLVGVVDIEKNPTSGKEYRVLKAFAKAA